MPDNASELTPQATQQTLHELRVHQIELEMQNEELRRGQEKLADSRARYVDLYDLAPVGYLTVSETGLIVQANLAAATLLGVARAKLVKMPFSRFILKDDQDVYYLYRKQLFETGAAPACELRLVHPGATPCWARLESTSAQDDAGTPVAHVALIDISGRKQTEVYGKIGREVLRILNEPGALQDAIQHVITTLKSHTGFDAVSIRLQHGEDFPYYAQQGFSKGFLLTENSLLALAADGAACRDKDGNVRPECTCGLVLADMTDPANPLFTPGGSCWTGHAASLLDIKPGADPRLHPRNQCVQHGYASVAQVPIRNKDRIVGLIQLNDRRKECFTLAAIELLEGIAAHIGAALMRKQAEQALLESEQEYRTLFNSAGDALFVHDEAMRVLAVNPMACERLGYTHAELMALTVNQIDSETDALQVPVRLAQLMKHGRHTFEATHRRKDGSLIPVEVNAQRITWQGQPAIMSLCRNITERKLVDQTLREWNQILELQVAARTLELRHSEARFSQLAEVTFEGIAISAGNILLDGNPQLAKLFGYELAEMIGRPLTEFLTLESRKWTTRHVRNNGGTPHELIGLRKDGSTFPLEALARLKTVQGKTIRVAALRDLSMVKQQAVKIQAQQRALEHAHRFALVSEVSSGIIHQIGQPLCAMGINVAAALAGHQACELQPCDSWEILKDIEAGVADMRKIISDLRSLAHPGQPHLVRSGFNDLVEGVLYLLRQEAENRHLLLAVSLGLGLPAVLANPAQLGQVILNLVRNAFDAHADCPPERRTVALLTRALPGVGVELSVRDAGTGIAPAAMPHLFTPFFSTKAQGLGIGLRLCQTIVETHGGRIEGSNNADGIGATFRVMIPAIQP
jgi:PAS domain S-box-containing protein